MPPTVRSLLARISTLPATLMALRKLQQLQWNSGRTLEDRQRRSLRRIVLYSAANVPFYRRMLQDRHIDPNSIRSPEDLSRLPTITRRDVVRNFNELQVSKLARQYPELAISSGSSGPPVSCYIDQRTTHETIATMLLFNLWASWLPGMTTLQIMRTRPHRISQRLFWRLVMRARFFNSLEVRNSTARRFAHAVISANPSLIVSYPSVLDMIARNMDTPPSSVKGVVVGSETVTGNAESRIERSFQRKLFNRYGVSEFGGALMQDCELHQGLHLNTELAVVEVLDSNNQPVSESEQGRVVITGLRNFVMPLIRYDVGDIGVAGGECACGRGFPVIRDIVGRTSEIVEGKDGEKISSFLLLNALHYYDYFAEFLKEFQFVDIGHGRVGLRIIPTEGFLRNPVHHAERIEEKLQQVLPMLQFEVQIREELERRPSGKQDLIVRE
jgi:phenylacetate-CoA ligase